MDKNMKIREWQDLPGYMKNDSVRKYYFILMKKRKSLYAKRVFDIVFAIISVFILLPVFLIISIAIKIDSKGPIMFRQVRVTQYGRRFKIYKFRTMIENAEKIGGQVTTKNDTRITNTGRLLRKYKLDEIPQLFNIISGDMSFVGTRPETVKYFALYEDEMMATLLLPAGVTSEASIKFKDEELFFDNAVDTEGIYINVLLPEKMEINLSSLEKFSFHRDISIIIRTAIAVVKKKRVKELKVNKTLIKG
jgi:lipopolysaccharide/colanic/teichoic acid biosynthesis glycosyltransferase